jgi:hypothetical protein
LKTTTTIQDYCREINIPDPRYPYFDIRRFEENAKTVSLKQAPFRHEFYAIALKNSGDNTEVNGRFLESNLFFNSPYQIITWDIKPDWQGWYIIFDREFLGLNPSWQNFIIDFSFFRLDTVSPIDLPKENAELANNIFQQIFDEYHSVKTDKFLFIQCFTHLLLLITKRYFDNAAMNRNDNQDNRTADILLVSRFQSLVETLMTNEDANPEIRYPSFYADKLTVHPNHLNAVVKRITGKTATKIIQNQLISSAKSLLKQTDLSVLVGNLYYPDNFDETKKYPTVLVGGSWTTVKEQMSGLYAEELAKQGFISLAIDPRYFGESEGQPRFYENPAAKIADFKNALTHLQSVQGVDPSKIFLVSVCASAGYMAQVAAQDDRVKGFATISAWLHDGEAVKLFYGGDEGVQAKIKQAQEAKKKFAETGEVVYIPSISTIDTTAAMFGEYDYYLNTNRGALPQWSADKFAVMSWEDWLTFDATSVAKKVQVPTLMIHSDGAVLAENAKRFFADIPHDNKVLHWTEGSQFDFYDQPKQVSESVAAINVFFKTI